MFIYETYCTITLLYNTLIMIFHRMHISIFHTKTYLVNKIYDFFIY